VKQHVLAVSGFVLVFMSATAGAQDPATFDALVSSTAAPRREERRPAAHVLGARVFHTDSRLGAPSLMSGNRSGVDPRILSGLKRMGAEHAARVHLARLAPLYGLTASTADSVRATVVEPADGKGPVLVTFRQDVEGIEVFRQKLTMVMTAQHELLGVSGSLTSQAAPETRLGKLRFSLSAPEAISHSYEDLHGEALVAADLEPVGQAQGPYSFFDFAPGQQAAGAKRLVTPARVKRVLYPLPSQLVPAWYVELHTEQGSGQDSASYAYVIAADDGRLLMRHNLASSDVFSYRVWADSAAPFLPHDGPQGLVGSPHPTGTPDGYQPSFVAPGLVSLQNAPFSQNDPWLPSGATETVGNNVDAYVDISGADGFDGTDFRASTTSPNSFDRVYDVTQQPGASASQRMATVTQAFYVANFLHDWFYDVGFTEQNGNAQRDNYGRGGLGNDSLRAETQDFSGQNNANIVVPADGARPRLQLYLFTPNTRYGVSVLAPTDAAGDYITVTGTFGPQSFDVTTDVVLATDNTGNRNDGCQVLTNTNMGGKIALIDRGTCTNTVKVKNAQNAGAVGVIIAHNTIGTPPAVTGTDATINIPVLSITQSDGNRIKAQLPTVTVTARLLREFGVHRDASLDNAIIAHEWGHLISNRLIGDGSGLTNNQGGAMGEGWGDFHALLMMVRAQDAQLPGNENFQGAYTLASYVTGGAVPSGAGNNSYYFGLRRYPYSTDFARNALTFKHIQHGVALPPGVPLNTGPAGASNAQVHNSGEVWATMLWECYAALLRDSARLSFEQAQDRMKRYLVLAYQLTPVLPTFLEARDALLMAAYANDPQDFKLFHAAFARRGAGLRAEGPGLESNNHVGVVESFVTGKDVELADVELVEAPGSCDNDGVVDHGERGLLRVKLYNTGADTLTATTASVSSSDPGVIIANGGQLTFAPIEPFDVGTAEVLVAVSGPANIRSIHFDVTYRDAQQAIPGDLTGGVDLRVNTDETPNSSATDDVESRSVAWSFTRDPRWVDFLPWTRYSETLLESFFFGPNAPAKTDISLVSPPLQVAATGDFGFTFQHRYSFEADSFDIYDGGVIELSTDDGQTWTDIGALATPGYVAQIFPLGTNPLAGRDAYGDVSEDYPAWVPVTVSLGTAYQGQTVRVRFRIGTDVNISSIGWDIDNVSFTGITNTPFSALTVESSACADKKPVADAGPDQSVGERTVVTLDGRGSSNPGPGTTLTYAWTQTAGPAVTLNNATSVQPTFSALEVTADTVLTFQLTVNDELVSNTDTVEITVRDVNRAPVADAGPDQTVDERVQVTLDGRGSSDPETGTTLSYAWAQLSGPAVSLSGAASAQPTFTPEVPANGVVTFQLTVSDGVASSTDTVSIAVRNVNRGPVAGAGQDQGVAEGSSVTLAGSGTDPDGDNLSYQWSQTAGPPVSLNGPQILSPLFTAPDVSKNTVLTFLLKVTDPSGLSSEDSVSVLVTARQGPGSGDGDGSSDGSSDGCGCAVSSSSAASLLPLMLLVLAHMSRRRRLQPVVRSGGASPG
jgi:MYXO-CTERM domain-containing protein